MSLASARSDKKTASNNGKTAIEGLFVHGGMGSIGMHAAPATARWLVDAVLVGDGNPKQEWLRPDRFPGWGR